MRIERGADGLRVIAERYRLWFRPDRPFALLEDPDGDRWAELATIASVNSTAGLDDSAGLDAPVVIDDGEGPTIVVRARPSAWAARRTVVRCHDDDLAIRVEVDGEGDLTDVHLLGGYVSAFDRWGSGFQASGAAFRSIMSTDPSTPEAPVGPAAEPAVVEVLGGSLPGRGHWFFTPGPLCFALQRSSTTDPGVPGGWASLGVAAPIEELTFTGLHYEPGERSFSLRLAYEGQTHVSGSWASPWLVMTFDAPDAYAAIAAHRARRLAMGLVPSTRGAAADWWREPIFCGWGAQCDLALQAGPGARAADFCRQDHYDRFLAELVRHDVDPGTFVIDDRWETAYGSGRADEERWPDLRGWIDARHAEGRRVLLWWKAWAPDALAPEHGIRNAAGRVVAADPTHPGYVDQLRATMRRLLGPDGYDADGLKVDFTAMTPSGPGMRRHGSAWGIALLHRLLAAIAEAARSARADALIVTQAPDPAFADVTDMIRLNDVLRLDEPSPGAPIVEHMVHRARIVRAAMPDALIDTDGWAMPDRRTWREYLEVQPGLGVPALYYAARIDRSGELLEDEDYAAIRRRWADYRLGLASAHRPPPRGRG